MAAKSSFIGRRRELAELTDRFARGARIVTLTGTGGVGKTRLALEVLRSLRATGEAFFVDLAALSADDDVVRATAAALRAAGMAIGPSESALSAALATRAAVLLLDNCDSVVPGCARMAGALIRDCPGIRLLATSREPLAIAEETVFLVLPLSLPCDDDERTANLLQSDAVTLFVARAQAAAPGFELSPDNARHVAEICRRLDGLPLAIELAAARVRVLAPHQIMGRLDHRFDLLRNPRREGDPRHRTLHATIAWSHQLLTPAEQALLNRLTVFAGGATLEAVEAVCTGAAVERVHVIDLLTRLAEKSFVNVEMPAGADARYVLLESIREFGREHLEATGEAAAFEDRHAEWFRALVERAEPELWRAEQSSWLGRLAAEHDNLRVVMERSLAAAPERALCMAGNLWRYCEISGRLAEGSVWLARAMAAGDSRSHPGAYARAAFGAGYLARDQGDLVAARRLLEESLRRFRALGERKDVGSALRSLAIVEQAEGNHARAHALFEEALELFRQIGHELGIGWTLRNLGVLALASGEEREAASLFSAALAVLRSLGDRPGMARTLGSLGLLARLDGAYGQSRTLLEQALALVREVGDLRGVAMMRAALGMLAYAEKAPARAAAHLRESLRISQRSGDGHGMAAALAMLGVIAVDRASHEAGLEAMTAAEGSESALLGRLMRDERAAILDARRRAHAALGSAASLIERRARKLPRPEMAALGERIAAAAENELSAPHPAADLTPRQSEVLRLIANGLTNRQIAEELALSEYTVMRHVSNLFDRLGVSSRAAAAAQATAKGIL